jgi:hypothetical protein
MSKRCLSTSASCEGLVQYACSHQPAIARRRHTEYTQTDSIMIPAAVREILENLETAGFVLPTEQR